MLEGIEPERLMSMTDRERRWLDNIKKAFHESDQALHKPEDRCLQELLKAIDTAKTLRMSLRGEDIPRQHNKARFIEFLGLEIPAARAGGPQFELLDPRSGSSRKSTLGEIIYEIRCMMLHENENLNVEENVDHHILLDWSVGHSSILAQVQGGAGCLQCVRAVESSARGAVEIHPGH